MLPYAGRGSHIRAAALLLRLPHQAVSTSLVFLHRFMASRLEQNLPQANVRTNDLLNAFDFVMEHNSKHTSEQSSLLAAQPDIWTALVGEQYYSRKQQLILDEQSLLRAIDFNIVVQHPHKYLLNFAKTVQASCNVVQLAICLLNDSLVFTSLSISSSASEVAAGALHLASQLLNATDQLPLHQGVAWWEALGVSTAQVEHVGHAILDALEVAADSL